jgi:nucleoside-diphosphate-sugar epimerase
MNNVLLIGSHGYIGSAIAEKIKCHSVDLSIGIDYRNLPIEFFDRYDAIILLAGNSSVASCANNQLSAFKNNVDNFAILLDKLSRAENRVKLIYASSSSVYGCVGGGTLTESYTDFVPHNTYDITKHFIDMMAIDSKVEYYGLRFGTVCGYSPTLRTDVMINSMVSSAKENGHIKLYVKDINRPILGINDLVNAVSAIISEKRDKRGIYNLASFNSTAEEIANAVAEICNVPIIELETPSLVTNAKEQTVTYDFAISSEKFINEFSFEFKEDVSTITNSLLDNWDNMVKVNRHKKVIYEP